MAIPLRYIATGEGHVMRVEEQAMRNDSISNWINEITKEGPLPPHCKAILIGLFEGEKDYVIYFSGSVEFDPEDDDWACQDENDYEPKNKYHYSGVPTTENWEVFQASVIESIRTIRQNANTILNQTKNIAVGFDSGDLIYL
jgi:hypothetical protein